MIMIWSQHLEEVVLLATSYMSSLTGSGPSINNYFNRYINRGNSGFTFSRQWLEINPEMKSFAN